MTEEEKEQSRQLNQISYINALNTHNWELQQKVMMLNAENERLREALKPFADAVTDEYSWKYDINSDDFRAAAAAIRERGE
jgi:predicted RNase H-like nuclease (RuvC/YqgF family)